MSKSQVLRSLFFLSTIVLVGLAIAALSTPSAGGGKAGTTLAAYKTIDICKVDDSTWRISGDIAVWNEGVVDTTGLHIVDTVQNKPGSQTTWTAVAGCNPALDITPAQQIPAGTTQLTATSFQYSCLSAPLQDYIRNSVVVTILNHSGSVGTPTGPNPKATWTGGDPPACTVSCGCTYTQGYWGSKPNVVWPAPYDRNAQFFLSGMTWQQILDEPNAGGNGYFILAKQYIAAVLNQANGACVPSGVQDTLNLATDWLNANTQGTPRIGNGPGAIPATGCYVGGSCGLQKDWGAILDDYNNGVYPGSPGHCAE